MPRSPAFLGQTGVLGPFRWSTGVFGPPIAPGGAGFSVQARFRPVTSGNAPRKAGKPGRNDTGTGTAGTTTGGDGVTPHPRELVTGRIRTQPRTPAPPLITGRIGTPPVTAGQCPAACLTSLLVTSLIRCCRIIAGQSWRTRIHLSPAATAPDQLPYITAAQPWRTGVHQVGEVRLGQVDGEHMTEGLEQVTEEPSGAG